MAGRRLAVTVAAVVALVIGGAGVAFAATPGVGDVSDAMRYDAGGPFGSIVTDLSGEDDDYTTVTAPFALNFFGQVSNGICISTNGGIFPVPADTDGCTDAYDLDLENLALSAGAPMIAVMAGDLDLGECADNSFDGWGVACEIYFGTTTISGRDAFIVTWYRVPMNEDSNDETLSNTFQMVIIKRATGSDIAGWDFDIEFNFGTITDPEDGYSALDPTTGCSPAIANDDCRYGVGWANFISGTPDTADAYELFATTPVDELADGGAKSLVANSLNSAVKGRYTFGMVAGVTTGFAVPDLGGALAATGPVTMPLVRASAVLIALGGLFLLAGDRRRSRTR